MNKRAYLDHIVYELEMLRFAYNEIAKREVGLECNAFIQSFAVHARSLYEFLTSKVGYGDKNARAYHFVTDFEHADKERVKPIIEKIENQIVHTGWARTDDRTIKFNGTDMIQIVEWSEAGLRDFATRLQWNAVAISRSRRTSNQW